MIKLMVAILLFVLIIILIASFFSVRNYLLNKKRKEFRDHELSLAVKNLCSHLDQQVINNLRPIFPGDPISRQSGIYCFWIQDGDYEGQYFIPIYVGKTNNFQARFRSHYKKIRIIYDEPHVKGFELKYYKICDYLKFYKLRPENIRFSVLEVISDSRNWELMAKREEYWMHKLGADTRGFNQLHALGFGSHPKDIDENDFFKYRSYNTRWVNKKPT
ncbi:GIY-YIG catalytic domain-containing protein [Entomoplasma freundtii]|uniref:Uncharacterized protein n=1 Tax=Entomoplasma freundtii TaxID=74700 RepID=A0A2K8NSJ3_9MOLU|nr:GIY-YIG nuclease family protein [Entomoplasma freundtii]ATZ16724.1 hypothetical protein EFREU_v1c07040 [Entomoplasma freundtii]TDY58109.1 GIY-YIG catalytic domain-containing protein [Entomoplasma freundtii]